MKQQRPILHSLLSFLALDRPSYQEEIATQFIKLLYSNLYRSLFAIVFIASFLVSVLWPVINHTQLMLWYIMMLLVILARFIDTRTFHLHPERHDHQVWYQHLYLGVASTALLWGFTPLLFFLKDQIVYNMFISIVIVGMSAGAVTSLAGDRRLSHIYLYVLLIPSALALIQQEGFIYTALFSFTLLFMFFVSSALREAHATLLNVFEIQQLYHNAQVQLIESEKRHRLMFEQAPTGTFYYDKDLTVLDCNTALSQIMHADRDQLIGLNLHQLPDPRPLSAMAANIAAGNSALYEGPYHSKLAGLDLWVRIQMAPLIDSNGTHIGGLAVLEDKSSEHAALQEAEFLSMHDPLTDLPNRKLLKDRMEQLIKEELREKSYSAVLFLDLDRFKHVNDAFGHKVGDQLLIEVGIRLKDMLRASDTLSRLGGDEFVVLLPMLADDQQQAFYHAHQVALKIHNIIHEPFQIEGQVLDIACSIGVVVIGEIDMDTDEILRRADIAMYQAKNEGRDRTHFYDAHMDEQAKANIHMLQHLRHAIEYNELSLHFQPIMHIDTNTVHAAEALLRWYRPNKGFIPPNEFIPIAEESGLINEIGRWVIQQACMQMNLWRNNEQCKLQYITINISPKQLLDQQFSSFLLQSINEYHLDASAIKLEITETALIENFDKTKELIEQLNEQGIDCIIDDFGTGYSSLSYLKRLPFTTLKIDRSFIRDILTDPEDEILIRAIISIAQQFNYRIIAEGVEEEAQRKKLTEINNTIFYQGFLVCKPCSASYFEAFITAHNSKAAIE